VGEDEGIGRSPEARGGDGMSFTTLNIAQRSPEWHKARCGLLTGSSVADVFARIKTGEAAARRDLRIRLVVERLTGEMQEDGFVSKDMQRGIELEQDALDAYEGKTGNLVTCVGFLKHDDLPVGCSPDGVIGDYEGILELKCPRSATHLRYLRNPGVLPTEHQYQVTHALFVTGAQYVDFASFDPRFPEDLRLFQVRVKRESVDMQAYELAIRLFLAEVSDEYEAVLKLRQLEGVA
jgi:hypothetical protein